MLLFHHFSGQRSRDFARLRAPLGSLPASLLLLG